MYLSDFSKKSFARLEFRERIGSQPENETPANDRRNLAGAGPAGENAGGGEDTQAVTIAECGLRIAEYPPFY